MNDSDEKPSTPSEEMDSATRREFVKVAGVSALGLAYSLPIIQTIHRSGDEPSQGSPVGQPEGESSSSSESGSGSKS